MAWPATATTAYCRNRLDPNLPKLSLELESAVDGLAEQTRHPPTADRAACPVPRIRRQSARTGGSRGSVIFVDESAEHRSSLDDVVTSTSRSGMSLGACWRLRRSRWLLDYPGTGVGAQCVKRGVGLCVAIANQEPGRSGPQIQPPEQGSIDAEKVAGQQPVRLHTQKLLPTRYSRAAASASNRLQQACGAPCPRPHGI